MEWGILSRLNNKKSKSDDDTDNESDIIKEQKLIEMAFTRYWEKKELSALSDFNPVIIQDDDYIGLTKDAIRNNDLILVKIYFSRALTKSSPDAEFFEIVADFYYSLPDSDKYGRFGAEYRTALNKMLEFHVDDGKYLMGRADYFAKCEDYDSARTDYKELLNIYVNDLWIPYIIAVTYRQQKMHDEAVSYVKYIKKSHPQIKSKLQGLLSTGDRRPQTASVLDSNDIIDELIKRF